MSLGGAGIHRESQCSFFQVCTSDDFRGLSKDQLVKILRSEELRIEDEYQVFTAAMDWVLHDVPKRKKHIVEVLEPVRFPLLSPQRLFKYIESKGNIDTSSCSHLRHVANHMLATLRLAD